MSYRVRLNVFEGPFDLLVYLIEHAQMSIYDIRIAEITEQYVEYIGRMQEADINVSTEFMVLAAELLEIKSKMLLPRAVPEDGEEVAYEDPRTELVAKLKEYKLFKELSHMLEERYEETSAHLEKPQEDLSEFTGEPDEYLNLDMDQFTAAFEAFLLRKKNLEEIRAHHIRTEKQRITTELRMGEIRNYFREQNVREADFRDLVPHADDKYDVSVTFSSVLEMMKEHRLDAEQKKLFGDIKVKATDELFEAADVTEVPDVIEAPESADAQGE